MAWVFTNGLGHQGSISGRVLPKTQKMVLDPSLLNTQHYKVRIKGKVENPGKGVAIKKGDLGVTLNYGCQQQLIIDNVEEMNLKDIW